MVWNTLASKCELITRPYCSSIGVAVLRYFNEIYKDTTTNPYCQPSDVHNNLVEDVGDDIFKVGGLQSERFESRK